jgi:hypothetical protein
LGTGTGQVVSTAPDRLYQLLPAIYRYRDYYEGEPLRSFMGAFQTVFDQIEAEIAQMGEDWFIETCAPRLIPYIGDLVGVTDLGAFAALAASERVLVGNAIRWRSKKGTITVLPDLLSAATGWQARVREFSELTAGTQHMRASNLSETLWNTRTEPGPGALGGPFDRSVHTASVRTASRRHPISSDAAVLPRGKYNLAFVGISLWRLKAYQLTYRQPAELAPETEGGPATYSLHPFGIRAPLFNSPAYPDPGTERGVPVPLNAPALRHELAPRRKGKTPPLGLSWFSDDLAIDIRFRLSRESEYIPVQPENLYIAGLDGAAATTGVATEDYRVVLDPQTGLLRFLGVPRPADVRVMYAYGFSADMGGGPYQRPPDHDLPSDSAFRVQVIANWDGKPGEDQDGYLTFATIDEALKVWIKNGETATASDPDSEKWAQKKWTNAETTECYVRISDSAIYDLDCTLMLSGRKLTIAAWDGQCPTVRGTIRVAGSSGNPTTDGPCPVESDTESATFALEGIWLEGNLVVSGELSVDICDSTIRPPADQTAAIAPAHRHPCSVSLSIDRSVVKRVELPFDSASSIEVTDSIMDAISGPRVAVQYSTVFGPVRAGALELAEVSIFAAPAVATERNLGVIDRCWFAPGSETPPRALPPGQHRPDLHFTAPRRPRLRATFRSLPGGFLVRRRRRRRARGFP